MKLFGGKSKKGKRAVSRHDDIRVSKPRDVKKPIGDNRTSGSKNSKRKMPRKKKVIIITASIAGCIVFLLGSALAIVRWEIQPFYDWLFPRPGDFRLSETRQLRPMRQPDSEDDSSTEEVSYIPIEEASNMNKITFLILGDDAYGGQRSDGGGNTDVVMVAAFDMDEYTLEMASIPRDTVVNVPWSVKKINSIWANMNIQNRNSDNRVEDTMEDTIELFSDFLGFHVDYWVKIDMRGFVSLVNAMPGGGVRVNVPRSIHMHDGELGVDVALSAGEQVLNGTQALALMRYRGYGDGDMGRIEAQQAFMSGAVNQMLSRGDSVNLTNLASVILQYVRTDMDVATMVRLGREAMKLSSENISFSTPEITPRTVAGGWYAVVDLDSWLEIVNTRLSPFYHEITPQHVSILTLDENGRFFVTDDNWQADRNWGR